MPIRKDMFLRKSKSKTELFVLLPNKPKDIMSPTNRQSGRTITIENGIGQCLEKSRENEQPTKGDRSGTGGFKDDLSDLIFVESHDKCLRDFGSSKEYDIMHLHRKYEKLREYNLQTKVSDAEFRSDRSWTSLDTCQRSPRRSASAERKSVRFEDDLSNSLSNKARIILPISAKGEDLNHNTVECKANSRIPVLKKREPTSPVQCCKTGIRRDYLESPTDLRESGSCEEAPEPRGILSKTLSENPFNIKRSDIFVPETNFRCHECEKMFKYQSNLKSHVMTVHGGALYRSGSQKCLRSMDDLLICDVCSVVFKYSVNLRAHKAGHSRNKLNATI
ncbi:uncharacterized protein LOC135689067 [Rhopilema esculentum]|uniref:uncharacterized protein LOC135689067 n=1 Tax=Rhopilema esculentum TaxID=499914 RepID=UPI0031CF6E30|eukprot:gene7899-13784_t